MPEMKVRCHMFNHVIIHLTSGVFCRTALHTVAKEPQPCYVRNFNSSTAEFHINESFTNIELKRDMSSFFFFFRIYYSQPSLYTVCIWNIFFV